MAIVLVHFDIKQAKYLILRCNYYSGYSIWNSLAVVSVNWGSIWSGDKCEKLYGWKSRMLEGCRGLNDFFMRLGVTTEFYRGDKSDTNVFGMHTDRGSDEACTNLKIRSGPLEKLL